MEPVTTVFDASKEPSEVKKKIVRGIVRHYKTPSSVQTPYSGILTDPTDLSQHEITSLQQILRDFFDGAKIEIVVTSTGESACAHGFVWMLTKPHVYERVLIEEWRKTFSKGAKS